MAIPNSLIVDPNCEMCDNGMITTKEVVETCCGEVNEAGECCRNFDADIMKSIDRCPNCEAYEDAMNDSINTK